MKRLTRLTLALLVFFVFGYAMRTHAQTGGSYTIYLPLIANTHMRVLYTDKCDPRTDPHVCNLSDSPTILNEFYAALNDIRATIQYTMPQSLDQLRQYDVVIANYCSGLYEYNQTPLLSEYVAQGGSVMV